MPNWLILLIVIGVPILIFVSMYNALVAGKNLAKNGWAQIDVQLKRRADLIPNLVETVKGAMSHERETLEAVIAARNQAVKLQGSDDLAARVKAEGALTGLMTRFMALMEQYPDIKATQNVSQLQEELSSTENRIGFARQHYNDVATKFNTRTEQIPWNIIAGMGDFKPFPLFEVTETAEREAPKVSF